jgi:hypothetical protein
MPQRIDAFALGWHPTKGTAFRVHPTGAGWSNWIEVPAADIAALAAIFEHEPVYIQDDRSITTGPEPIGFGEAKQT